MPTNLIKMQQNEIDRTKKILESARKDYFKAVKEYESFPASELLSSAPNLLRAPYSDRVAWIMAVMAKLAYIEFEANPEEHRRLELHLEGGGFELVKTFSEGSTQAFLAKNYYFAVLAFRGTEPKKWADVRADIRAFKTSTSAGRVHTGFMEAYNEVSEEIKKSLINEYDEKWPLYITGHSLGGALATVATRELEAVGGVGDQIAACYTFGSPRVGNKKYEATIKVPVYRVVHSTDVVTLVPNIGYTHAGDPRFISSGGELYRKIPFFRRGFEMLLAILPFFWGRWVTSHDMETYRDKLRQIAIDRN